MSGKNKEIIIEEKKKKASSSYIISALSFFIPFLVVLVSLAIQGFIPFGKSGASDIFTTSGNSKFITYYYRLYDYIHGSYNSSNIKDLWAFYMTDFTNLIILIFPRTAIIHVLSFLYAIKLGLAGLFMNIFLLSRPERCISLKKSDSKSTSSSTNDILPIHSLLISSAYALSVYMLVYGTNISFISTIVVFPLVMLGLEKLIYNGKWTTYYIAFSISIILSVYASLVVLIFSALYMITPSYKNIKHMLKCISLKILSDALALGSTLFVIIPALCSSTCKTYIFKEPPLNDTITSFFDSFRRLLTISEPSSVTNVDSGIDIYCGVISILLVIIYIICPKFDIFSKIRRILLIGILFLGTTLSGPNSLLNAYARSEYSECFFAFTLIFMILLLSHEVLTTISDISHITIIVASVSSIVLTIISMIFSNTYLSTSPFIYSVEIIAVLGTFLFFMTYKNDSIKYLLPVICILGILEIALTYSYGINRLSKGAINYDSSYAHDLYIAEQEIKKDNKSANIIQYDFYDDYFNPIFNSINGVDYVLCPRGSVTPDYNLTLDQTIGNVDIYSNPYSIKGFLCAPKEVSEWTYSITSPYKSSESILSIIENSKNSIFQRITPTFDYSSNSFKNAAGDIHKEVEIYTYNITPQDSSDTEQTTIIYANIPRANYIGSSTNGETITRQYPYVTKYLYLDYNFSTTNFYSFNPEEYQNAINNLKTATDTITCESNSYLILSIGKKPEYTVNIDGVNCKPITIDDSLYVAPISQGTHNIKKIEYVNYNIAILYIISFITIILSTLILKLKDIKRIVYKFTYTPYRFIKNNYVYFATIALTLLVFNIGALLKSCTPWGNISMLPSDGYVQTYPNVQAMIDSLSLKSLIPSTIGYSTFIFSSGADYISSFISTMINLIYRLLIWTNDGKTYSAMLGLIYLLYTGPAMIFYMTHRYSGRRYDKKDPILIVIALAYNLSAYMIGFFAFNNFVYGLYLPLIVWGLERLVYEKKPLVYILILALHMSRGYYAAFLLCEFIALFFLTLDFTSIKDFARKTVRFAISSILAAGLAAYNLLPSFISTLNSPYRETDSATLSEAGNSFTILSTIFKSISQYQVAQNGVVVTRDNNLVNIYAGLLPLLFVAVYIFDNNIKRSIRVKRSILAFLLFWSFGNTMLNYVFHGFHFQSNVPNRFAIFFIFLLIGMFADAIKDTGKLSNKRIMLPIATSTILLIILWIIYPIKNNLSIALSIIFMSIYVIIFAINVYKKLNHDYLIKLLVYISVIELIIGSSITFTTSIGYLNKPLEDNIRSIGKLTSDINNDNTNDIYVSEYINSDIFSFNMGLINHLNTISGFNSYLGQDIQDMSYYWGLTVSNNNIQYTTGNPLGDMMLHVKYHIIDTDDPEYSHASIYNRIKSHNNMELFENPYYLPIGFMTAPSLMQWNNTELEDYTSYADYQNALAKAVTGENLYTVIEPPKEASDDMYMNTYAPERKSTGAGDLNVELKLPEDIDGKIYCFFRAKAIYIGDTESSPNNLFYFTLHDYFIESSTGDDTLTFGVLNTDTLQKLYDTFSESKMYDINKTNTYISGEIDVKKDGILYLSIPNYDSTEIYVDGNKSEVFDYLHGTGLNLSSGKHTIKIVGVSKGYMRGVIISMIALVLTMLFVLLMRKQKTNEDNSEAITENKNKDNKANKTKEHKHNNMKKASNQKINYTYLTAFILPLVIMTIAFVYSGFAPFGPRDVLTANDQSEYMKFFHEFYDRVHSGKAIFGYSLYDGTGYDFTTVITYYLSDPTNLLILLFPRAAITIVLNILYLIKIGLSGLTMSIYLKNTRVSLFKSLKISKHTKNISNKNSDIDNEDTSNKSKKQKKDLVIGGSGIAPTFINNIMTRINLPIVALSMMYTLSNYMLGPGFNVAMQGAVVIFPIVILGLDKLIYDGKKKLYITSLAISFLLNYRISIITCIFTILYMLVPSYNDIKHLFKSLINKLICDICVYLCAAVIILNNLFSTFWWNDITTIDGNSRIINAFDVIKMMSTGTKPANVLMTGNNIYLYSGIITLLFVLLFTCNNRIKLSTRIRFTTLYCILFSGLMFEGTNTLLNGFQFIDGLSSNYLYTMIFLGILIVYIELKSLGETSILRVALPSLACAGLIICTIFLCYSYNSSGVFIKSLEFIFIYAIVVIIYCNKSMTKWLMKLILSITLTIELCITLFPGIKLLSWFTYPYYRTIPGIIESSHEYAQELYNNNTITTIDPEQSHITPLDLALSGSKYVVLRGEPISNLTHIKNEKKEIISVITNHTNYYDNDTDITNITLLTEKYNHLKNSYNIGYDDPNIYKVFKNKDYYILDKSMQDYSYNKYAHIESLNKLSLDYLNEQETMIPIEYEEQGGTYADGTNNIFIYHKEGGDLYFTYTYISCKQKTEPNSQSIFKQCLGKNTNKYKKQLYKFSMENYIKTLESLESGNLDKRLDEHNSSNSFSINSSKDGYMTIGLYNRPGWNIIVNDAKVKQKSFLENAMLIPVTKGNNTITISYKPTIFYIGTIISLITIIILIVNSKIYNSKKIKNHKKGNESK